jgi:hypothetical protein
MDGACLDAHVWMDVCLQSELYEARTMYAKAVALREALEARTTRAEAEKAAAEASLLQAKAQVS